MKINDADHVYYGDVRNNEMDAVYIGATKIWPNTSTYIWELSPIWLYDGQYDITTIPATGGTATATWRLIGKQNGSTVYGPTQVTPTSIEISDSTNFSYINNVWEAKDRKANGFEEGRNAPSQEQLNGDPRSCILTAIYSGSVEINNQTVLVNVSCEVTMTQNQNPGVERGQAYYVYHDYSVALLNNSDNRPNSQSYPTPAYQSTVSAITSCNYDIPYYWSATNTTKYRTNLYLDTSGSTFSSNKTWATANGSTITAASRGTEGDENLRNATITASFSPRSGTLLQTTTTLWQQYNKTTTIPASCQSLTIQSFKKNGTVISFIDDCNSSTITAVIIGTYTDEKVVYTSNAYTGGDVHTNVSITPSSALSVSSTDSATADSTAPTTFTVNNKHKTSTRTWTVTATYLGVSNSKTISQEKDVVKTDGKKDWAVSLTNVSNNLTTAGGNVTFTASATHTDYYYWQSDNDVTSEYPNQSDTISVDNITLDTSGSTASGASGRFAKETTPSLSVSHTTMRKNSGYDKVKITLAHPSNSSITTSTSVLSTIENKSTNVSASCSSVTISGLPVNINTCLPTQVSAEVYATWTESGRKWTAYDYGDTEAKEGMALNTNDRVYISDGVSIKVNGSSVSNTTFELNNNYNTSPTTHTVIATFLSKDSSTYSISQNPDSKSDWITRNWATTVSIGSNSIWAGGGTASISASGSHEKYRTWTDETEVDNEPVSDTPTLSLVDSNGNAYTGDGFGIVSSTLVHYDMKKKSADSVKVKATNNTVSTTTAVISITNNRRSTAQYGPVHDYGNAYSGNYRVDSFTVSDYTSSSNKASFKGATTGYNVTASHDSLKHQAKDIYYYYDSNFGSEHGGADHNDADHRDTIENGYTNIEPRVLSTISGDSVDFSYGDSWVSASGGNITILGRTDWGGDYRSTYIYAINHDDTEHLHIKSVQIWQAACSGIFVTTNPSPFTFDAAGGTGTMTIAWYRTNWTIHYPRPLVTDPNVDSFSSTSGGATNTSGTTVVTVVVNEYNQWAHGNPTTSQIEIRGGVTDVDSAYVDIFQVRQT